MKLLRVFPRKTNATPDDDLVWIGHPGLIRPEIDKVHVSVVFDYDKKIAEEIASGWSDLGYDTEIGGVAYGDPGGDFVPGKYLKKGYVITSRGCPNHCWFCDVWQREGEIRELPITEGWNVLDSNLLACSEKHVQDVFDMLSRQPRSPEFTGGLDPALLNSDIAIELKRIKTRRFYMAYDTPDDYEHLVKATHCLKWAGFTEASHIMMCFVLIGYPKDSFEDAKRRLNQVVKLGLTPMAMLYRKSDEPYNPAWRSFQREWARPAIIHSGRRD